jgi:glycine betaine catabolism B
MNVTLDHIEDIAANIKTFWFKPDHPIQYTAGQFIELFLPHENADDRGQKRWFTLSSSPTEAPLISITTKFATDRGSTFKATLHSLQPGTQLRMVEPMGDFVLPKDKSLPLLFVAGGMGVTPMRSMVKYLSDAREQRNLQMIYGVNHTEDFAFLPLFEAYDMKFRPIVKDPGADWKGETGGITPELILEATGDSQDMIIYLSGPEPMIEDFDKALKERGVNKHRIVTDFFPGYPAF